MENIVECEATIVYSNHSGQYHWILRCGCEGADVDSGRNCGDRQAARDEALTAYINLRERSSDRFAGLRFRSEVINDG